MVLLHLSCLRYHWSTRNLFRKGRGFVSVFHNLILHSFIFLSFFFLSFTQVFSIFLFIWYFNLYFLNQRTLIVTENGDKFTWKNNKISQPCPEFSSRVGVISIPMMCPYGFTVTTSLDRSSLNYLLLRRNKVYCCCSLSHCSLSFAGPRTRVVRARSFSPLLALHLMTYTWSKFTPHDPGEK